MIPNGVDADQPLSFNLDREFSQRRTLAEQVRILLQPTAANHAVDGRTPYEEVLNYTVYFSRNIT